MKQRTIKFDKDIESLIEKDAKKNGINFSEQVRRIVEKNYTKETFPEDWDKLLTERSMYMIYYTFETLKATLPPEQLAKYNPGEIKTKTDEHVELIKKLINDRRSAKDAKAAATSE